MNKPTLITILTLFISSIAFCQTKKSLKDFNKDGVVDRLEISEDGGSAFSSTGVNYTDGKTKMKYEFSVLCSFGSFFSIGNAPNVLGKPGREELGKLLFSRKLASKIDPSLQWLIDACSNRAEVSSSELVDFSTKYNPVWMEGNPVIPDNYFVLLENSKYPNLLKNVEGSPEYNGITYKSDYFWLTYSPHNHNGKSGDFKTIQVNSENQLLITSHGVILKTGQKYSWIFINDDKVFEANEKLRLPSISEAQMFVDFVLIRQTVNTGATNLFIVNPKSGFVVRLSNELMQINSADKMEINKVKEFVELSDSENKKYSLTLSKIKELFKGMNNP
ncbi:MAG: hypothetical protein V9F46_05005 [Chitinophagaceae bacterium]